MNNESPKRSEFIMTASKRSEFIMAAASKRSEFIMAAASGSVQLCSSFLTLVANSALVQG